MKKNKENEVEIKRNGYDAKVFKMNLSCLKQSVSVDQSKKMVESKSKVQSECEKKHKAEKRYSWMNGKNKKTFNVFFLHEKPNHSFFCHKLKLEILPPLEQCAIFFSKPSNLYKFAQMLVAIKLLTLNANEGEEKILHINANFNAKRKFINMN